MAKREEMWPLHERNERGIDLRTVTDGCTRHKRCFSRRRERPFDQLLYGQSASNRLVDSKHKLRDPHYEIHAAEIPHRAGFTGKERDVETQYDYFGARYYDSRIGRWLSVDPMGSDFLYLCPYVYGANNPITTLDLLGQDTVYVNGQAYLHPTGYYPTIWGEILLGVPSWATGGSAYGRATIYHYRNAVELREQGHKSLRNNNPGNIMGKSPLFGAIGTYSDEYGDYLIFASRKHGREAMRRLLHDPNYRSLSLGEAIALWDLGDPGLEDESYVAFVESRTGFNRTMMMSSFTERELGLVQRAMEEHEGSAPTKSTILIIGP